MEDNKFFKYVWRINGIIVLIAGVLAIGVLTFVGYKLYFEATSNHSLRNIVNIQEESEVDEDWRLGHMAEIKGSPYVMVSLNSDQRYTQSYYSKSSLSPRNYLFINSTTNEQHWLFGHNKYLIADTAMLSEHGLARDDRNVRAILYQVVKKDTDGDRRLTSEDAKTISISRTDGRGYRELIEGVDIFVGHRTIDKKTLIVLYQKQGVAYSANVSLSEFTVFNKQELPKISP